MMLPDLRTVVETGNKFKLMIHSSRTDVQRFFFYLLIGYRFAYGILDVLLLLFLYSWMIVRSIRYQCIPNKCYDGCQCCRNVERINPSERFSQITGQGLRRKLNFFLDFRIQKKKTLSDSTQVITVPNVPPSNVATNLPKFNCRMNVLVSKI